MTVVFYDGLCGLCDRFVQFLLRHDRSGRLWFAALQGAAAERALRARGYDPAALDTVYVVADFRSPAERTLRKSRAVLHAVTQLGGGWAILAGAASVVPTPLADVLYGIVARVRYSVFGRFEACPVPRPEWRDRFID